MKQNLIRLLAVCLCAVLLVACGGAANWKEQYDLGMRYLSEENYQEAILAFTEAIGVDPNQAELYIRRAGAYIALGETEENLAAAMADYEQAKELGYTAADLWLGLADLYIRQGDLDKAREVLEEGLEATGGDPDIQAKLDELNSGTVTDAAGNLRRRSGFDTGGNLAWYHVYTYDENGREMGVTHYDAAGNELGHADILYDEEQRIVQTIGYESDTGQLIQTNFVYKSNGYEIEETFLSDGTRKKVSYDSNNNEILRQNFDADGNIISFLEFEYDAAGNLVESCLYGNDGNLTSREVNTYDAQGHAVETARFDGEGNLLNQQKNLFDSAGNVIKSVMYEADGSISEWSEFSFDDQNRCVLWKYFNGDGTLMGYHETEYTEDGRTITRAYDENGELLYSTEE